VWNRTEILQGGQERIRWVMLCKGNYRVKHRAWFDRTAVVSAGAAAACGGVGIDSAGAELATDAERRAGIDST
jgi:hypothetical protein